MNTMSAVRRTQRAACQAFTQYHPAFRISQRWAQTRRDFHVPTSPPTLLRKRLPSARILAQPRHTSTEASSHRPLTDRTETTDQHSDKDAESLAARKAQEPAYEITFTCRKCLDRSSHRISKQAYHFGTTLITCPGCKNRHLISDHLKIFSDKGVTIEDILKEKGQFLRKGRLGEDGDIEFYDEQNNEIGRGEAEKSKSTLD